MNEVIRDIVLSSLALAAFWDTTRILNGRKADDQRPSDYWAFWIAIVVTIVNIRVQNIERKIDEMNQCGPAEVTVSDE